MSLEIRQQIKIKGSTLSEDPILYFDNIGTAPSLAAITVDSFGSGTTGEMIFQNAQFGTLVQALRIGQGGEVYIGSGTIDSSAVLQVDSSTKGFLVPRNPDPATNISAPVAPGLMAFDETDNEIQYYNGTDWISLNNSIYGGSGTIPSSTIASVTDLLSFTDGDLSIGTTSPKGTAAVIPTLTVANGDSTVGATSLPIATPMIVESDSTAYIGILSPDASASGIYMGSPTDPFGTSLTWQYSTLETTLASRVANGTLQFKVGNKNDSSLVVTPIDVTISDRYADFDMYGTLTITGDNEVGVPIENLLRFVDVDTVVTADHFAGKIEFFSSDTSGPGVKSYIGGIVDGTANGSIIFGTTDTAGSLTSTDAEDITGEQIRITSDGILDMTGGGTINSRHIQPDADATYDLGSESLNYRKIYAYDIEVVDELDLGEFASGKLKGYNGTGAGILFSGGANHSNMQLHNESAYKGLRIQDGAITPGTRIATSALLELNSTTRAVLLPRIADPSSDVTTPVAGMIGYDSTDNEFQYYNGTDWVVPSSGGVNPFYVIANSAPLTETVDWNNGESQEVDFELKAAGAVAFTLSNPVNGQSYTLKITQGANLNTITWPASILWEGGTDLVPTATDNAVDVVTMVYDGTNYYASYGTNFN